MIALTHKYKGTTIYLNPEKILMFVYDEKNDCTTINLTDLIAVTVAEGPDEIAELCSTTIVESSDETTE